MLIKPKFEFLYFSGKGISYFAKYAWAVRHYSYKSRLRYCAENSIVKMTYFITEAFINQSCAFCNSTEYTVM